LAVAVTSAEVRLGLTISGAPGWAGRFALTGNGDLACMTLRFTTVALLAVSLPTGGGTVSPSSPSSAGKPRWPSSAGWSGSGIWGAPNVSSLDLVSLA